MQNAGVQFGVGCGTIEKLNQKAKGLMVYLCNQSHTRICCVSILRRHALSFRESLHHVVSSLLSRFLGFFKLFFPRANLIQSLSRRVKTFLVQIGFKRQCDRNIDKLFCKKNVCVLKIWLDIYIGFFNFCVKYFIHISGGENLIFRCFHKHIQDKKNLQACTLLAIIATKADFLWSCSRQTLIYTFIKTSYLPLEQKWNDDLTDVRSPWNLKEIPLTQSNLILLFYENL